MEQTNHTTPKGCKLRQTEAQVRETQRRLEHSLQSVGLGPWTYDAGSGGFWADECSKRLHGAVRKGGNV